MRDLSFHSTYTRSSSRDYYTKGVIRYLNKISSEATNLSSMESAVVLVLSRDEKRGNAEADIL